MPENEIDEIETEGTSYTSYICEELREAHEALDAAYPLKEVEQQFGELVRMFAKKDIYSRYGISSTKQNDPNHVIIADEKGGKAAVLVSYDTWNRYARLAGAWPTLAELLTSYKMV